LRVPDNKPYPEVLPVAEFLAPVISVKLIPILVILVAIIPEAVIPGAVIHELPLRVP
jgi:hypothetical protein